MHVHSFHRIHTVIWSININCGCFKVMLGNSLGTNSSVMIAFKLLIYFLMFISSLHEGWRQAGCPVSQRVEITLNWINALTTVGLKKICISQISLILWSIYPWSSAHPCTNRYYPSSTKTRLSSFLLVSLTSTKSNNSSVIHSLQKRTGRVLIYFMHLTSSSSFSCMLSPYTL